MSTFAFVLKRFVWKTKVCHPSVENQSCGKPRASSRPRPPACPSGTFLLTANSLRMRQNLYDWPQVGGFVVVWLVIAVVAGMGLVALFDPGSIDVLVTAEL